MENINKKTIYKEIKDISLSYIDIIPSIISLVIYYYFLLVKLIVNYIMNKNKFKLYRERKVEKNKI